jgi:hypothetical protein
MGLFSSKRIVQVGGGVSRLREDAFIRNTTGLIVNSALINNQDLTQAILLNEMTGTVSSFKQFLRLGRRSSTIGTPTSSFLYTSIDKNQLSEAIRTDISQSYPVASEINDADVYSGPLNYSDHVKYALQENNSYNITTDIFVYGGINYYFDSYVNQFSGTDHTGYTINGTKVGFPAITVSFTLAVPLPAATFLEPGIDEFGSLGMVEYPINYWVVYYTHAGRMYIWINDMILDIFTEITLGITKYSNPELEFAPIIPIRNDHVKVTSGVAFNEAKRALKLIGLEPNAVNDQITDSKVEDVYITLFSNLISAHQDQLAYNYAFFEYMDGFGIGEPEFTTIDTGFLNYSSVSPDNRLNVSHPGVYTAVFSWGYIEKTRNIVGTLAEEYTYELAATTYNSWLFNTEVGDYIIRKRTSPTTYDQLLVRNFATSYVVKAGRDVKAFSVPTTAVSGSQLVIPFSYKIALSIPGKFRETLFLRCMHVGVFSKVVTKQKWYQQSWFSFLILVVTIIYAIYSTDWTAVASALEAASAELIAEYALQGIVISASTATLIILAKYALTQYILKAILIKVLASTNSSFLKIFASIAYVYISMQLSGANSLSTGKQIIAGGKSLLEASNVLMNANLQQDFKSLTKEQKQYDLALKQLQPEMDRLDAIAADQDRGYQALTIMNMFKEAGEAFVLESDINEYDNRPNVDDQIGMIAEYVNNALKLLDPPTLILESETLLA